MKKTPLKGENRMTDKEALDLAIKYLRKRLSRIDKAIEEDFQAEELIGEYIHYITLEDFERAQKERSDLIEAIAELIALRNKEKERMSETISYAKGKKEKSR